MNWFDLAITLGGYVVSGIVYFVNSKKVIFTQDQLKEMKEGLDALTDGIKSLKDGNEIKK